MDCQAAKERLAELRNSPENSTVLSVLESLRSHIEECVEAGQIPSQILAVLREAGLKSSQSAFYSAWAKFSCRQVGGRRLAKPLPGAKKHTERRPAPMSALASLKRPSLREALKENL